MTYLRECHLVRTGNCCLLIHCSPCCAEFVCACIFSSFCNCCIQFKSANISKLIQANQHIQCYLEVPTCPDKYLWVNDALRFVSWSPPMRPSPKSSTTWPRTKAKTKAQRLRLSPVLIGWLRSRERHGPIKRHGPIQIGWGWEDTTYPGGEELFSLQDDVFQTDKKSGDA